MSHPFRKLLLVSTVGCLAVSGLPIAAALLPAGTGLALTSAALAGDDDKGGDDNNKSGHGSDDSGSDDKGSSDDSGSDDKGGDDSSDDDGSDDKGGDDKGGASDDDTAAAGSGTQESRRDDRPGRNRDEVTLSVSNESLQGLLNGSLIAVDNLGRVLEVEVEMEHGVQTVKVKPHRSDARRIPGAVTGVVIKPKASI